MENKLQQLTQKLYDEGLEKGRAEADKLVADAKAEARKIVAEARAEAEEIVKKAEAKAEDVSKNTMTEISLAGKQAVGRIKSEIASLIIAKATARGVKEAVVDPAFIKEMLVAVAKTGTVPIRARSNCRPCCPRASARSSTRRSRRVRRSCSPPVSRWAGRRR